ncbi:MAG: hypothetical protein WA047_11215 [Phenylobacterium sp.]
MRALLLAGALATRAISVPIGGGGRAAAAVQAALSSARSMT